MTKRRFAGYQIWSNTALQPTAPKRSFGVPSLLRSSAAAELGRYVSWPPSRSPGFLNMIRNIREILPFDLLNTYDSLNSLRKSSDEWRYIFMADDEFRELMNEDVMRASGGYWKEMLYRTHIVCLVSAFKTLRWMESLDSTFENYYGFCASLRGLLESCADTFYTLRSTPLSLAKDFFVIKEQIGQRSSVMTTHAPLEDLLIHYIQATKLSNSQAKQYPDLLISVQNFPGFRGKQRPIVATPVM